MHVIREASEHHRKVCQLVRPSVGPSVGPPDRPLVGQSVGRLVTRFFLNSENEELNWKERAKGRIY